jgi:hypothetical protein
MTFTWTRSYLGLQYLRGAPALDGPNRTHQVTVQHSDNCSSADVLALCSSRPFTPVAEALFDGPDHESAARAWAEEKGRSL